MKRLLGNLLLLLSSLLISFGAVEIILRLIPSTPQSYEDIIKNLVDRTERLFTANTSLVYDIRGLYNGADTAQLNVSKDRLIEPQPRGVHKDRVLFFSGQHNGSNLRS